MLSSFTVKILKLCLIFILIQVVISNLIYNSVDVEMKTQIPLYIEKYKYLKEHKNDLDTIFIGSSRTYRHINPKSFNKESTLRSYNLGVPDLRPPQTILLLDKLFNTLKDSKIKHIFFELCILKLISK